MQGWAFLTLLFLASCLNGASLNDLSFEVAEDEMVITDCDHFASGTLIIPPVIDGFPVTTIADDAFDGCSRLESIQLPAGILSIGRNGFRRCLSLPSLTLPNSLISMGGSCFRHARICSPSA